MYQGILARLQAQNAGVSIHYRFILACLILTTLGLGLYYLILPVYNVYQDRELGSKFAIRMSKGLNMEDKVCVYAGSKVNCIQKMAGVPIGNSSKYFPILVGVGPAKTGSSAVFKMLGNHSEIGLADANAANQSCCGPETYFFRKQWPEGNFYTEYGKYFLNVDQKETDVTYLAEKTPKYHDDPFVPARISGLLHPSSTWLIFTLRKPVDAHISLFFHRHKRKNPILLDFLKWSQNSMALFESWKSCISSGLKSLGSHEDVLTIDGDVARQSVFSRCKEYYHEGVSQYKYSQTLPVWEKMLHDFPKMCVLHSQLIENCQKTMEWIQRKVRISHENICQEPGILPSAKERLLELNGTKSQKIELEGYLLHLSAYFEPDEKEMHEFCGRFGI